MGGEHVGDDEILFRRIPLGSAWFEPPDRISSFNFKLRPGETGLSVYRERVVNRRQVLQKAWAIAGEIRALTNAKGEPLHLDVVAVADEDDPGHAEIRGPEAGVLSTSAAKALKKLFRLAN